MILENIESAIRGAFLEAYNWEPEKIAIVEPEPGFGDFAIACHSFARELKVSPQEIAMRLADIIRGGLVAEASAAAGYLNLRVEAGILAQEVLGQIMAEDRQYGAAKKASSKVGLEYSSPNTNKPLHLGHVRNNVLGMAIARLFKTQGRDVVKMQVINDRGIHIMKSLVAYQKLGRGATPDATGEKGDHFVGRFYVMYNEKTMKADAEEALRKWEAGDKEVLELWGVMNAWVYEGFNATYKRLGSEFDETTYESKIYLAGKQIVEQGIAKGIFYKEADGSTWVDLTDDGLDKKILARQDGTSVYITQDLGLAADRHERIGFDSLVYVVGHEQEYHFKALFAVLKKLGYEWAEKLYHLSYGLVFLPEGKMKSREGKVVDADNIMDEVVALAREEITKRFPELDKAEVDARAEAIGLGALKFMLLRVTPTQPIHFNPKEAIAFEGSTGPYVQYAHARITGIIENETALAAEDINFNLLRTPEERALILKLFAYPAALQSAATHYNPGTIATYLLDLARAFNTFYHTCPVLRAETDELKYARIFLVKSAQIVLRNGLSVLGIAAPEKM